MHLVGKVFDRIQTHRSLKPIEHEREDMLVSIRMGTGLFTNITEALVDDRQEHVALGSPILGRAFAYK